MKGITMAKDNQLLSTGEFASLAGIPTSSVTKLIREGKIKAEKKAGKWMIRPHQLHVKAVQEFLESTRPAPKKASPPAARIAPPNKREKPAEAQPTAVRKTYSIAEFAGMTYLTELGVKQWLKQGRLLGQKNENGDWLVDAANLDVPNVKRLVREGKTR
jgi:hypothetical protein